MNSPPEDRGLIVACDVDSSEALERLVSATGPLQFIRGFKLGSMLALSLGLPQACKIVRRRAKQSIIYDHQKFGTDIPAICGGGILQLLKSAGVSEVIAFPMSGIETLKAFIGGCKDHGLEPVIGGEMTHPGYLVSQGGYVEDGAPSRIYRDAANLGVSRFVVPATKPEKLRQYRNELEELVKTPTFLFPGVGKGQGGDIVDAFRAASPHKAMAIVGRGIYAQSDPANAARILWEAVVASESGDTP